MKLLIGMALSLTAFTASAQNITTRYQNLLTAAEEQCQVGHLERYAESYYLRFMSQVLQPENKMLNTAFFTTMSVTSSRNQATGSCVIVFLGLPNDPVWEARSNYYVKAKNFNRLPKMVFAGFSEDDSVILVPENGPKN
jgi:hypothetical protein